TKQLKPTTTETEAAGLLEYEMRRLGAAGASFETIVAAGRHASKPHARPSPKHRLGRRTMIQFDWGARVDGYCSDMSRIVTIGEPPWKLREVYAIVLEAQLAAIEAVRPGA